MADEAWRQLESDWATKRAMSFTLRVEVLDEAGAHALTATIEWFITRRDARL